MIHDDASPWRILYERYAPLLAFFCLFVASVSSAGTAITYKVQGDERQARVEQISKVLKCFDEYAVVSAATNKAIRDASVALADATTHRDVTLDAVFNYIATDPAEDDPRGARLFGRLLGANASLVEAQAALAQARAENPVPDAPSTSCEVQP